MAHDALIETDRYRARFASGPGDVARALRLRAAVFRGDPAADDTDAFDARCRHVLVEDRRDGALRASFRMLTLDGTRIGDSYSAQYYGLEALAGFTGRMLEVGRFCIAPGRGDGDVLRLAWAALTRIVDDEGVGMLFGCSSFFGTEPAAFAEAFALLKARHLAPSRWRPVARADEIISFAEAGRGADAKAGLKAIPSLLRTYLAMGGWVSDHAVIDRDLGTVHVFTGLEVGAVPPARARALRGLVGV